MQKTGVNHCRLLEVFEIIQYIRYGIKFFSWNLPKCKMLTGNWSTFVPRNVITHNATYIIYSAAFCFLLQFYTRQYRVEEIVIATPAGS
jgi:hypothetical protein